MISIAVSGVAHVLGSGYVALELIQKLKTLMGQLGYKHATARV